MNFKFLDKFISSLKQLTKFTKVKKYILVYILINENLILLLMLFIFQRPSVAYAQATWLWYHTISTLSTLFLYFF